MGGRGGVPHDLAGDRMAPAHAWGKVWWVDVWEQDGYRIQTHKVTGVRRLLDPANVLIAMGDFEDCQTALARELETPPDSAAVNLNIELPTLGGAQFWGDEFFSRGWKIQRNAITTHYRLLDGDGTRRAWGTYEQCAREWRRLTPNDGATSRAATLVILLHGILRSPDSFNKLAGRLRQAGYDVCAMAYPSTQASIPTHADQLNRLLERLEGYDRIHFVCHSMGGLVVRKALSQRADPRVVRLVTLGTPHKGSIEANLLRDWYPYKVIFGPSGQQLIEGSEAFAASLPPPLCPMGCIAGGRQDGNGYSPIVPGDDDGTVSVASALYDGATDRRIVESLHSFLMNNDEVIEATLRFLQSGRF